jgi:hypothetical protein
VEIQVSGWYIGSNNSVLGLIHEAELLSESKGLLKRETYKRLISYWHFSNALKLFHDVKDTKKFAATITKSKPKQKIEFYQIVNLFHPQTIDLCFKSNGAGSTPGIKNESNQWELRGHKNRIVTLKEIDLEIFINLFESPDVNTFDIRLPHLHSNEVINVIKKITKVESKIGDLKKYSTMMFDETNAQNNDLIKETVGKVDQANDVILSGPHIYVCNPFYQEVPSDYRNKQDFRIIDLKNLGSYYYPRTVYKLTGKKCPDFKGIKNFRNARRKMGFPMAERTLATSIIPPNVKHINGIISDYFEDLNQLLIYTGLSSSIVYDFFIKILGKTNIYDETINVLPFIKNVPNELVCRVLRLNCMTRDYNELWNKSFDAKFLNDSFTKKHNSFASFKQLNSEWSLGVPLRNPLERRQALLEIDVIVSMLLGISLEELISVYKIQFPIFYKNEKGTWYDKNGNVVYSVNPVYQSINRKEVLESWNNESVSPIDGYIPPFETFNREEDYRISWKEFELRFKQQEGKA